MQPIPQNSASLPDKLGLLFYAIFAANKTEYG